MTLLIAANTAAAPANQAMQLPLADIMMPPAVSWWPLAIGWWVLIGIVLALLVAAVVKLVRRQRKRKVSKLALARIASWQQLDQAITAEQCNALLKAVALQYADKAQRSAISSLAGNDWFDWLKQSAHSKASDSVKQLCDVLAQNLYRDASLTSDQQSQLLHGAQQWVQHSWILVARNPVVTDNNGFDNQPAQAEASS